MTKKVNFMCTAFRAGFQSKSHNGSSLRIQSKRGKRPANHYILVLYNGLSVGSRGIMGFAKNVYRREKPPACIAAVSVFSGAVGSSHHG